MFRGRLLVAQESRSAAHDERRTTVEMMAKGTYAHIILATADFDGTFTRLQASGADVVQEPTKQPYGVRANAPSAIPRAT